MEWMAKQKSQIVDDIVGMLEEYDYQEAISLLGEARESIDKKWKNAANRLAS